MNDKELKLQVELLQKQNTELKDVNRKLREQLKKLTEQVEELILQADIAQAIDIANRGRN